VYHCMHSSTTRSCTCTVVVATQRQHPLSWNGALQTSAVGCQETASSSTLTKPSYCGSDRDMVFTSTTFVCHNYISVMTQSRDHVCLLGATISSDLSLDLSLCRQRLRLLLALAAAALSAFTRHAVSSYTRPLIRVVTRRLL